MIKLRQPALALHACDTKGFRFQMSTSWDMPPRVRACDVVYWILYARDHAPEQMLPNVVIDCHGDPGKLYIRGERAAWSIDDTINIFNASAFSQLRNKEIGTIWLHSCRVAQNPDGPAFCETLAKASGCYVVASQDTQHTLGNAPGKKVYSYPYGCIDNFEGPTYCWDFMGKMFSIGQDGKGAPGVV